MSQLTSPGLQPGRPETPGGWPPSSSWPPPPEPPPPRHRWAVAIAIVVATIGAVLIASEAAYFAGRNRLIDDSTGTVSAPNRASSVGALVDPAIVDVTSTLGYQNAKAAGTGIVLTPSGEILTNHHVVAGATSISVADVGNGRTYSGTVVGYDATEDIAVVQLANASGLKTAALGESSKLSVGQDVVAIGNAGGVGGTPSESQGTVTALNRSIVASDPDGSSEQLTGLIQTSARLLSGDSGGPLVDSAGRVVGIDTAGSGRFSFRNPGGQGFAIPVSKAVSIAHQITAGESSPTVHVGKSAFLGVEVRPPDSIRDFASGAAIAGVVPGSPAASTGLSAGDAITSVGGERVTSPNDLSAVLRQRRPGDRVRVVWTDQQGDSHSATVQLANGPVA